MAGQDFGDHRSVGLPESTKELCQLRWLDDALTPMGALESGVRFVARFVPRKIRGLKRRLRVLLARLRPIREPVGGRSALGTSGRESAGHGQDALVVCYERPDGALGSGSSGVEASGSSSGGDGVAACAADAGSERGSGPAAPGRRKVVMGSGKLRAGDVVMVLPLEQIEKTLNANHKCQGLKFLRPMEEYCGKTFRVFKRVRYILDEHEHRMMKLKNTVLLEGVICEGRGIYGRENCDKSCYFFWKEPWLRKVE